MKIDRRLLAVGGIILTYAAFAFLAFRFFVPLFSYTWYGDRSPEARRFHEIRSTLEKLERELQAVALRDSIVSVLPEQPIVLVTAPPSLARMRRGEIEGAIRREVATAKPRATVALAVIPYSYAHHPVRLADNPTVGTFMFTGAAGRPYCAVTVRLRPPPNDSLLLPSDGFGSELGPCALWARYGEPGAGIRAWLEQGGYDFATRASGSSSYANDMMPRALFGGRRIGYGSVIGEACRAGRLDVCARGFMVPLPAVLKRPAPGSYNLGWVPFRIFGDEHSMLFEIENEFGRERFELFWKSSADFHPAFRNAFGMSAGEWLHREITAKYGSTRAGPAVPAGSLVLSLLTIGLLIGVTVMIAQRRYVA